jgi:hypothetical protein
MKTKDTFSRHGTDTSNWFRYEIRPGIAASAIAFDNLRDSELAIASYREFERLQRGGIIPAHCRFQVQVAPAVSVIRRFVIDSQQEELEQIYDRAIGREIERMTEAIPPERLAIQWDLASAIFERLERGEATRYGADRAEMLDYFSAYAARLGDMVPAGVDLLFHLCYGNNQHKHSVEPSSLAVPVQFANRVLQRVHRPVQLFHAPVPRTRLDDAYFAPLRQLEKPPETKISLGLVHYTDGVEGTRKRIDVARKYLPEFLIATECGLSHRPPERIPELMHIHAEAARGTA